MPSELEKPIDTESPLTAKAIMSVPWEQRGEGPGRHRQRAVLRGCTRLTLPKSKGFDLPRSRTPWLWVISTSTEIQTRHVPREAPKCYFLNFYFLILKKKKKKESRILGKSLMRSGHVRTVQNASTLYTNVNRGSRDNVCDPKFNGGRTIISPDTLWSTSVVWYHMDEQ